MSAPSAPRRRFAPPRVNLGVLRNLFNRGPNIGAPVPVAGPGVNVNYPHAPIVIQPAALPMPGGGNATATIYRMLDEIRAFPVGNNFFQALTANGKQIGVRYAGPNNNQAAGAVRGYVLLRQQHDSGNAAGFGAELQLTIQNMQVATGNGIPWLADQLYRQDVTTWANGQLRPLGNPPRPPVGPGVGMARPLPPTPPQIIQGMINNWIAGGGLPTRDEVDALLLVLEPWLRPGLGCATRINFDPHKEIVAGVQRPPHCGLFHELVHAYYNGSGRQLGREDSLNEGNGGRLFELMAVGMGPFAAKPFHENAFRAAVGAPLRNAYP
jgi:hypothetical protein